MVQLVFKGFSVCKAFSDIANDLPLTQSIAKLLKIQRIHIQMTFLRRNDDVFYILLDGDQRACFDIVISAVGNEIFNTFSCLWVHLHLVKNYKRLTFKQFHTIICGQEHKKRVEVIHMLLKIALDLIGTFCKVDQDIALVLVLAKLLTDSRLADTSCTLDKKGFFTIQFFFQRQ